VEILHWFIAAVKKYVDFTGRARRKEYWYFNLLVLFTVMALRAVESSFGVMTVDIAPGLTVGVASGMYLLLMACPLLAVTTRRLHDTNRSGWWQLLGFVPLLGMVVIMIFASEDSYPGDNKYGKNPRGKFMFISY
jgi:uncharacterized membrane protein YhaH (DUF805 family)